jgi:hypothetical protein
MHGLMLRIAYGEMKLAEAAERKGGFDELIDSHDASINFLRDMGNLIESAKLRLLVGSAVYAMRLRHEQM